MGMGMGRAGGAAASPKKRSAAGSEAGRCSGVINRTGKALEEATVALSMERTPSAAGPEQGQPCRRGSVPALCLAGCLSSPADIPRVSPECETFRKCCGTNPGLVGAGSDFSGARGWGERLHTGLGWETPPAQRPAGLALKPGLTPSWP